MKLSYVNFVKLQEDELLQILNWRNSEEVRSNLKQQHLISRQEHLAFCQSLRSRPDLRYYQVCVDHKPAGVVTYTDLDFTVSRGEYGLYTVSKQPGVGMLMGKSALYLFFEILKLNRLRIEVLSSNQTALRFNEQCLGFVNPQLEKEEISVGGKRIGLYSYEMTFEYWQRCVAPLDLGLLCRLELEFEGAAVAVS